jgi:MFS family permease
MGLVMTGSAVGVIIGIPIGGLIFDQTGSYEWLLIGCLTVLLVSTLLTALVRPTRHHGDFVSEGVTASSPC